MNRTYITIYFDSSSDTLPSMVFEKMEKNNFKFNLGEQDFYYDWEKDPSKEDIINLANVIHSLLHGYQVSFKMRTVISNVPIQF